MDGGNTFRQAASLGTAKLGKNTLSQFDASDAISTGETEDWFKFRITGRASSFASMDFVLSTSSGVTADLYRASTGKKLRIGRAVAKLDQVNTLKSLKVVPGLYFLKLGATSPASPSSDNSYLARVGVSNPVFKAAADGSKLFS
jgi:hypothetical protein